MDASIEVVELSEKLLSAAHVVTKQAQEVIDAVNKLNTVADRVNRLVTASHEETVKRPWCVCTPEGACDYHSDLAYKGWLFTDEEGVGCWSSTKPDEGATHIRKATLVEFFKLLKGAQPVPIIRTLPTVNT